MALDLVALLARASGDEGMVGGQMLDLAAEGRFSETRRPLDLAEDEIALLQAMKTGALIRCAVEMGTRLGSADANEKQALADYGAALGQAFQIADDLLDAESDALTVGKATGKDAARGKATLVGLWGAERARAHLADLIARADTALAAFGERAALLRETAVFVGNRRN
jgi:farnesyl diphosphate synthase